MAADQKLYVQVLRQIHQLILDRGLKPGDLLPPEQVLAAEFGASRNVVREAIKSRNYDLALVGMNLSEVPDVSALLETSGALNFNHYSNDAMDLLIERARAASDEDTLQRVYSEIQMTVVDRLPVLGLLFRTGTVLAGRSIGGLYGLRAYDNFNGFEFLKE